MKNPAPPGALPFYIPGCPETWPSAIACTTAWVCPQLKESDSDPAMPGMNQGTTFDDPDPLAGLHQPFHLNLLDNQICDRSCPMLNDPELRGEGKPFSPQPFYNPSSWSQRRISPSAWRTLPPRMARPRSIWLWGHRAAISLGLRLMPLPSWVHRGAMYFPARS